MGNPASKKSLETFSKILPLGIRIRSSFNCISFVTVPKKNRGLESTALLSVHTPKRRQIPWIAEKNDSDDVSKKSDSYKYNSM